MLFKNTEIKDYYLESTINFYNKNLINRLKFLEEKKIFFYEISKYLSKIIKKKGEK